MKFGKVVEQPTWPSFGNVELSDPPIYSPDKRYIQSKDGMLWTLVAPHAAAAPGPMGAYGTAQTTWVNPNIGGCVPAPGPFLTLTINPEKS